MTTLTLDAISADFYFDQKSNRYRYSDSKRFAPKKAILNLTRTYIESQKAELIGLAERLDSRQIDLIGFQRQAAEKVKAIHLSQLILGRNGVENVSSKDFLSVGRELKKQYFDGIGLDGSRYGLKNLAQDIKNGKVSPAQLKSRLRMFGDSGKLSYWYGVKELGRDKGKIYAVRVLGDAKHCPDCPRLARQKPMQLDSVLLPGQGCQCLTQCKCRLVTMTFEDAIKRGL